MTQRATVGDSLLELSETLAQRQLRDAGAELASAIAHAVGTPLNVISGRAELIRHDPSNALAQVARIEEQVKKLATGLRQIVDYLAVPEPRAAAPAASPPARAGAASSALASAGEPAEIVDAKSILSDVAALAGPVCRAQGVQLSVEDAELGEARVERWHALGIASSLVSAALRQLSASGSDGRRCSLRGSLGPQGVTFELTVPGVSAVQGWQLEHFHARPAAAEGTEFHRTMSICATMVRGHGGRLQAEAAPDGHALLIRFWCRNEAAPAR